MSKFFILLLMLPLAFIFVFLSPNMALSGNECGAGTTISRLYFLYPDIEESSHIVQTLDDVAKASATVLHSGDVISVCADRVTFITKDGRAINGLIYIGGKWPKAYFFVLWTSANAPSNQPGRHQMVRLVDEYERRSR